MEAYLDNSATTYLCSSAKERMVEAINKYYGNPSSLHSVGTASQRQLDAARGAVARSLSCEAEEIVFTGSGTLANNTAIFGAAHALRRRGNRIVTTCVEHPSVSECMVQLEKEGFEVIYLKVDKYGRINKSELMQAVNSKTILVSLMYVNNEVGSIMPIETAKLAVKRAGAPALIHCDAVQAYGKLPIKPSRLGVDLLSASAHKINGPKGVGFLYVRKGVRLAPYIFGGGQEGKIYSGTQPMPAIMGLHGAVEELPDLTAQLEKTAALRDYLVQEARKINGIVINSGEDALPYIVNISAVGHPSQTMLNYLSDSGVYVSGGSACSKGHRSKVLTAMGLAPERIDSALRISLSRFTTREEIDMFLCALENGVNTLRKKK
ncbi:MAG: cysteine desulfurase [Clostridia bacterium]|nr:cysteine desulfurase [Clostridia bacterium]